MLLHSGKCCGSIPFLWVHMVFSLRDGKPNSLCILRHASNFKSYFLFTAWETEQNSCLTEGETGGNWALDLWWCFSEESNENSLGASRRLMQFMKDKSQISISLGFFSQCFFTSSILLFVLCWLLLDSWKRFCLFSANKCLTWAACRYLVLQLTWVEVWLS